MKTIIISALFVILSLNALGQNENGQIMTSFVPKTEAYDIYYPKHFKLIEDDKGIVTMTDTASAGINISISSYSIDKKLNNENLVEHMNGFMKIYFGKEISENEWFTFDTKYDNLIEGKIEKDNVYWTWWGISYKKQLVVISINKDVQITEENLNLVRFMIDNMIISK